MANYNIDQLLPYMIALVGGVRQALIETTEAVFQGLQKEGEPISYPVQWDTDLQRRAYFATGGFGAGIPYQRTNAYIYSGRVEPKPYGATLFKPHPAGAIGGTFDGWQSRIHTGRWTYIWDVVEIEMGKLPQRIRENVTIKQGEVPKEGKM